VVRVLGVTISLGLSLDKHVSNVCAKCFFWLRQLRRVRRSLDVESVKTLVLAFVTTRLDYCNSVVCTSRGAEVCDRQTSTSAECCCTPSQWYPQIRSWSVTSAARRPALAGRSRTCTVQAWRNSAPVSATQSPAVPD